ncbi:MAG: AAA family ATPase [Anaerolineae bacterium]|nr:AAA family ATPase [Anaerolineae bacterium]MBL6965637.1 AAA family ATPase [Anaerolineales bacterium]
MQLERNQKHITDNLDGLLSVLPPYISQAILAADDNGNLLEIVLDLGRVPTARFVSEEIVLAENEVSRGDIDYVGERISQFDDDNRAGLERTLHRISAIRNRRGDIVGLTCRVGRSVYGTTEIIKDLIEDNKSLLILGRPGVGKTTMLREAARILADTRRVVIVDTSNEIGGDGDVPHPAVGRARRMQVAKPSLQHEVMIEAVENHNPEVIVIDEIGRELEALAARTIAERGVQLIGTAHGNTLENLLLNPTLSDLIGGIESVTLSDEEARRRGTQKTVLERRSPPTFDVLIEIQTRDRLAIHLDVATAVDALLRTHPQEPEIRYQDESGEIHIRKGTPAPKSYQTAGGMKRRHENNHWDEESLEEEHYPQLELTTTEPRQEVRLYSYGVARNRLRQAARQLNVPIQTETELHEAQAVVTLRHHFRKRNSAIIEAETLGIPIYVLRSDTRTQLMRFLSGLFNMKPTGSMKPDDEEALQRTQQAIRAVLEGERWVELDPASSYIRRLQHQMAEQNNLTSYSHGKEPHRRVRIYRE